MNYDLLRGAIVESVRREQAEMDEASLKEYKAQYKNARSGGMGRVDSAQYAVVSALIKDGIKRDRELVQQSKEWKKSSKKRVKNESYAPSFADLRAIAEGRDPGV